MQENLFQGRSHPLMGEYTAADRLAVQEPFVLLYSIMWTCSFTLLASSEHTVSLCQSVVCWRGGELHNGSCRFQHFVLAILSALEGKIRHLAAIVAALPIVDCSICQNCDIKWSVQHQDHEYSKPYRFETAAALAAWVCMKLDQVHVPCFI